MPLYKETKRNTWYAFPNWEKELKKRDLVVNFISTPDQPADIFTKALPSPRFLIQSVKVMGVLPLLIEGYVKTSSKDQATTNLSLTKMTCSKERKRLKSNKLHVT